MDKCYEEKVKQGKSQGRNKGWWWNKLLFGTGLLKIIFEQNPRRKDRTKFSQQWIWTSLLGDGTKDNKEKNNLDKNLKTVY